MKGFQDIKIYRHHLRCENFVAVVKKNAVFWEVTPWSLTET